MSERDSGNGQSSAVEANLFDPKGLTGGTVSDPLALWSYLVSFQWAVPVVGGPNGFGHRHLYSPGPIGEVQDVDALRDALSAELKATARNRETGALLVDVPQTQVVILNLVCLRRPARQTQEQKH
jgi:hypothetical protein